MEKIHTEKAPQAIGPYSQATIMGNLIFTSGQIAINPATGNIEEPSISGQTHQVCQNLQAVLEAGGSSLTKVLKTTCFLQHISDFQEFNSIYEKYFENKPARSCVEVSALPKGALIEIEVIAEK